jgi:4-hydroxymandelate oxidase
VQIITPEDLEATARARLTPGAFAYIAGGAERELSLAENLAAWSRIGLMPSHLHAVAGGSARATLFGQRLSFPAMVAPMAFQRLACDAGEGAMRLASAAQGIGMVLSCQTSCPPEALPSAATPLWFQLYLQPVASHTYALAARALAAGATALVVTIDAPISGLRDREQRAGFQLPDGIGAVMLQDLPVVMPLALQQRQSPVFDGVMARTPGWADLAQLCAQSPVPVLAKGVLSIADARRAVAAGCAGIVVSNHGGRVLDGTPAPASVLAGIRAACPAVPILVDGGIRRGSDVFKAIALGADAVMIGRPALYGLAVDGAAGASWLLQRLREEFEVTMALCGCVSLAEIGPHCLTRIGAT